MDNKEENKNPNTGEEQNPEQTDQGNKDPLSSPFSGGDERYRSRGFESKSPLGSEQETSQGIDQQNVPSDSHKINESNEKTDLQEQDNDPFIKGYNPNGYGKGSQPDYQNYQGNRDNALNRERQAGNSFLNRMSNIKSVANRARQFRDNPQEAAKDVAKDTALKGAKAISKAIPLPVKIGIICIVGGFLFMIMLVATLGDEEENTSVSNETTYTVGNDKFWWPVAGSGNVTMDTSDPTDVVVCPNCHFMHRWGREHTGLDLHGGSNIIAAMDGVVVEANDGCEVGNKYCGREWGNFVQIKHNNGTYTGYAHMVKGSIKVKTGDEVKQGQVLGKMGNTGYSKGVHLHFEIRVGKNKRTSAVDPLTYIDPKNPRPITQKATIPSDATNIQKVCLVLKSNGYPDEAVAGIIGNMQRESGVKIDPAIVNHIKCVGIVQWCATRKTALQSTFGSSWSNIDNQIDYVIKELNSMPSLKKYLMEKHTPGEHADKFCNVYEIPGVTECAKSYRRDYANGVYSFVQNGCK